MISVSIMSDPRRAMNPLLLERLAPLSVTIVDAPGLTLWQCAQTAWGLATGGHHLVLHDDVTPCVGFAERLRDVVTVAPDVPLCLWGSRTEPVMPPAGGFLSYSTFNWGGALVLPRWMIPRFLDWCDRIDPAWNADDTRFTLWCCAEGWPILVPIPNLVQHPPQGSIVRPGAGRLTSPHYLEDPGPVRWNGGTVEIPGDRKAFQISRRMHYVR